MDRTGVNHKDLVLNEVWMKAATAGSLWASFEIIVGSLLHNLRLPFAGTILTAFAVIFLVSFSRLWPEKGILWRAGLICALMKSVSPSAVILGPMIGIFTEALIMEIMIRLAGRNLFSWILGGALAVLSALVHKIVNLLFIYGFDIVEIYTNMFLFASRQLGMEENTGVGVIVLFSLIYLLAGIAAAVAGYYAAGKAMKTKKEDKVYPIKNAGKPNDHSPSQRYLLLLFFHLTVLILVMTIISPSDNLLLQSALTIVYTAFVLWYYPRTAGRIKKPFFWLQLLLLMILAGLFLEGTRPEEFDPERILSNGAGMMLRALLIITSFSAISKELSNPKIRNFLVKNGFARAYLALQLSFTALPAIIGKHQGKASWKKNPFATFWLFLADAENWLSSFKEQYRSSFVDSPRKNPDHPNIS